MRADEITDTESFKAWLDARPQETRREEAVALAARAAMRVFPYWAWETQERYSGKFKSSSVIDARMMLTSSAAAQIPSQTVSLAAGAAADAVSSRSASTYAARAARAAYAARAVARAAFAARSAATTYVNEATTYANDVRARVKAAWTSSANPLTNVKDPDRDVVGAAAERIWGALQADCAHIELGQNVMQLPLWKGAAPDDVTIAWKYGSDHMQANPGQTFWFRWYEAILDGRPLTGDWDSHWQLLHDIALIPDEDWEKGAEHVAGLIEEIERNYAPEEILEDLNPAEAVQELEQRLPLNESVAQDAETKRFYLVEDRAEEDPTIETLLEQVEDNLDDCLASHNGIRGDDRVARVVRRVLSKYREKPLRIEMDFTDAIKGFRSNLTSGEYDKTDDNSALLVSLEDTVRLVRKTHPEVAEVRDHLAQVEMSRLSDDDKAALAKAKDVLVEASIGELAEDFGEDIAELLLPVLPRAPSEQATGNAPPLPGASRTFSRAAKMLEIVISQGEIDQKTAQRKEPFWDRTADLVLKIDNSAAYKGARIVGTVGSLAGVLWAVVQIGLRVLTVL